MRFRRRREPKPEPTPPEWVPWARLDLPDRAIIDNARSVPASRDWQHARTVMEGGARSGPLPIVDGVVPVRLPENYVGRFEVHLHSEEGTVLVVAEGHREPGFTPGWWTRSTTLSPAATTSLQGLVGWART